MNQAQFHLMITHFPLVGTLLGILTLATGMALKNATVKKTGLYLILFPALMVGLAYLSGEGAEEIVEEFPGVDHHLIHEHAEKAYVFLWLSMALAVLAATTLWFAERRKAILQKLYWATLVMGIWACVGVWFVGHSGGLIRHPEIGTDGGPLKGGKGDVLMED